MNFFSTNLIHINEFFLFKFEFELLLQLSNQEFIIIRLIWWNFYSNISSV